MAITPHWFRKRRTKLALGFAFAYLIVELAALPLVAAYAPLQLRMKLPGPLFILSQSSKAGLLPHDWTLVLGDSYSHGYGDWLTTVMGDPGNPAFHSTHVLHELTGTDVMSFGHGGAGSMKGMVYLLEKRLTALRRTGISDPGQIIVFVYEGNDFVDNLKETLRYGELQPGDSEAQLTSHCAARARSGFWAGVSGTFFFPAMIINATKGRQGLRPDAMGTNLLPFDAPPDAAPDPSATNVVRVGDDLFRFIGPAQGPPLGLDEAQLGWGLTTLKVSLNWLKGRFDEVPVRVVFLPSPLSCYELASSQVLVDSSGSAEVSFEASLIEPYHRDIVERVRTTVTDAGLEFLDATGALREAARQHPIHGPLDGAHFNRAGYEALGRALAARQ
ncbi:MAG: hypothetical protein ACI8QZ_004105 [Chlamydiales bacterium]|jgi:hypothetical protein